MWTKERVIAAYHRATNENGGVPPGQNQFDKLISTRIWRGKYFARFSELVRETGYEPRKKNLRHSDSELLTPIALFVRKLGRLPTEDERLIERQQSQSFPSQITIRNHFRDREGLTAALLAFCAESADYDDILAVLRNSSIGVSSVAGTSSVQNGFIYLMKYGRHYKIGFSNDVGRRRYDLKLLVPGPHQIIHSFETDDPRGVEAYWHKRFADKLCDGTREYFDLSPEDVAAFKRRKNFM